MKKEHYNMKNYLMKCPHCNGTFIITKSQVLKRFDGPTNTFYYVNCPECKTEIGDWTFGFLVRNNNPGWLYCHKMIIYKGK